MNLEKLTLLRAAIAETDRAVIQNIAKRLALVAEVALIKKDLELPIKDHMIERDVVEANLKTAQELGVPQDLIEKISRLLISTSLNQQNKI